MVQKKSPSSEFQQDKIDGVEKAVTRPINIMGEETVDGHLGVYLNDRLDWRTNTDANPNLPAQDEQNVLSKEAQVL